MAKATFVNFYYRSYQVLLTETDVIIPRWAIQAPGSLYFTIYNQLISNNNRNYSYNHMTHNWIMFQN